MNTYSYISIRTNKKIAEGVSLLRKVFLFFCVLCFFAQCNSRTDIEIANLRCELLSNPQGIDLPELRFSWEIISDDRDVHQTHYHILVASSLDKLNANKGDLWDSRKTASDASVFVPYSGKKLESRMECFWKVKITTNKGISSWSVPASWSMAFMNPLDWQARWIGLDKMFQGDVFDTNQMHTRLSARYFRKEFEGGQKPVKATVYVSGLGLYELYVNGQKIGDQELTPMITEYTKVIKYSTFDVTKEMKTGKNAVGVVLGNGRYFAPHLNYLRHFGFPKMIFQMEVEYPELTACKPYRSGHAGFLDAHMEGIQQKSHVFIVHAP